jgi:hypothetical protein
MSVSQSPVPALLADVAAAQRLVARTAKPCDVVFRVSTPGPSTPPLSVAAVAELLRGLVRAAAYDADATITLRSGRLVDGDAILTALRDTACDVFLERSPSGSLILVFCDAQGYPLVARCSLRFEAETATAVPPRLRRAAVINVSKDHVVVRV